MRKTIVRTALASVALAAGALAYVHTHPLRRSVEPLAAVQAHALLAAVTGTSQGPAAAGGLQRAPRTVVTDVDNVRGLRFTVSELDDRFVAVLTPFAPDPQHSGHMTQPCLPAHALVRHDGSFVQTDYPMAPVGSSWVTAVPKLGLALLPGDRIAVGAWSAGTAYPDPDAADLWQWWEL